MTTKERKRELKKMYLATQKAMEIKKELAHFYLYLRGWLLAFPEERRKDAQLVISIGDIIKAHDISLEIVLDFDHEYTVSKIKESLVQQHLALAKVLTAMSECGLDNLPSWDSDTWTISAVHNLFVDLEYVLNELEIIYP
jgi:hypothetical protein